MVLLFWPVVCYTNPMNIEQLSNNIKARFDHNQAKSLLKEKYSAKMIFVYASGLWRAGPELINICVAYQNDETVVLEDTHGNPVEVVPDELLAQAKTVYQEQMNAWLVEFNNIKKQR